MPRSRMKAEIPRPPAAGSVFAMTTAVPATLPFVMKAFVPSSTKASPVSVAVVRIAAASEPEPGSVSPQAPSTSPRARGGRYRSRWAAVPKLIDVVRAERVVRPHRDADGAVDPRQLLHHEGVGDVVEAGPSVLRREQRAQESQGAELRDELGRELLGLVVPRDDGSDLGLGELPGGASSQLLLGRELEVHDPGARGLSRPFRPRRPAPS